MIKRSALTKIQIHARGITFLCFIILLESDFQPNITSSELVLERVSSPNLNKNFKNILQGTSGPSLHPSCYKRINSKHESSLFAISLGSSHQIKIFSPPGKLAAKPSVWWYRCQINNRRSLKVWSLLNLQ